MIDNYFFKGHRFFIIWHSCFKDGWLYIWLHQFRAKVRDYAQELLTTLSLLNAVWSLLVGNSLQVSKFYFIPSYPKNK